MNELIASAPASPVEAGNVPCNGCTSCCHGDLILLHEDFGDDPSLYQTQEAPGGGVMIAKDERGDCVYLRRGVGCSIHEKRPAVCREFDCAGLVKRMGGAQIREALRRGYLSKEVVRRGKQLLKRGYRPREHWRQTA